MNNYITVGHLESQIKKTHPKIADVLLMRIVLRLHKGDIEPLSLLEVTNIQAERNGWQTIPTWLYNEVGGAEKMNKYLKAGGADPYGSEDFVHLYSDEWEDWYADISEIVEEVYRF